MELTLTQLLSDGSPYAFGSGGLGMLWLYMRMRMNHLDSKMSDLLKAQAACLKERHEEEGKIHSRLNRVAENGKEQKGRLNGHLKAANK